jgi:ABC-type transport system involved in multi-copper enzyme maturation permease subunit
MGLARAWLTLLWLSFRRLFWSANTLMVLLPLAGCGLAAFRLQSRVASRAAEDMFNAFDYFSSRFVIILLASFLVPICALAYGTTSIGGDREDRTLLFLLMRPIPRPLILLAKVIATLPIVLGLLVGSFFVYCELIGEIGRLAFRLYLPAVVYMAVAYVGLFHFFAVSFKHSTIIALIYALFMEFFLGNMPGIIKRVAVSYYGRSMMYQLGAPEGLEPPPAQWFEPVSAQVAAWSLAGIAVGGLLAALVVFQRREYRDLT